MNEALSKPGERKHILEEEEINLMGKKPVGITNREWKELKRIAKETYGKNVVTIKPEDIGGMLAQLESIKNLQK